jgi:hypothetical protein
MISTIPENKIQIYIPFFGNVFRRCTGITNRAVRTHKTEGALIAFITDKCLPLSNNQHFKILPQQKQHLLMKNEL